MLLNEVEDERVTYFAEYMVAHPSLLNSINEVYELVLEARMDNSTQIFNVIGPSGVGKTTLSQSLEKRLFKLFEKQIIEDPSFIPYLLIEAVAADSGVFNWKDFYVRCLAKLNETLIDKKVDYEEYDNNFRPKKRKFPAENGYTAPELRRSLENAIKHRRTQIIIIDEAQHIAKMGTARRFQDQLDTIKSLANVTNAVIVCIGTYELLNFVNLSGQLSRRSDEIHFPRYDIRNKKDLEIFRAIITHFKERIQKYFYIEIDLNDEEYEDLFFERSLGLTGVLKDWLKRSVRTAVREYKREKEENEKQELITLKFKHIERAAPSINKVSKMLEEIIEGESRLEEKLNTILEVREKLGMPKKEAKEISAKEKSKGKRNDVGLRNPKRDKVGVGDGD
ncbi:TniB family NTP-binding protein [Bacillus sp. OV166]|uniref:TniB family NTP-binding protein n=1 Tax=Bacillus sp. OV166 TaxID=1882763 RepID=UPI00211ABF79|nr:TniB family NTP-binding protein [Bacillus sp. OV166]